MGFINCSLIVRLFENAGIELKLILLLPYGVRSNYLYNHIYNLMGVRIFHRNHLVDVFCWLVEFRRVLPRHRKGEREINLRKEGNNIKKIAFLQVWPLNSILKN